MNSFKKEISPNEPSLRIGTMVPENTVNLAYVNGPELASEDTIELYDYSLQIPENTTVLETFKGDFNVGDNRLLITDQGKAIVPVENVIVTGVYKELSDKTWAPLYYHYKTRFMHYEKNPPYTSDNTPNPNYRIYLGHNIRVMLNNVPATGNYIICLEVPPQPVTPLGDPDEILTWNVHIFSEFTSSQDEYYTVEYSKWNATKKVAEHNYEEIYNSEPYYIKTDKATVMNAPDEDAKFNVEKLGDENGYRVYVSNDINPLNRTPILLRWRVRDADGQYSTWKSDELLRGQSLYTEDYGTSQFPVYIVEDEKTKKVLCQDVSKLFETCRAPFTVEWQRWNGASWYSYLLSDIVLEINSYNRLTGWTSINTGDIIDSPGKISYNYPFTPTDITLEGWLDPPDVTYTPVVITNVGKASKGATATANVGGGWAYCSNPTYAIDGGNPFWLEIFGLLWNSTFDDIGGSFYGRSNESENPPSQDIMVTINLAKPVNEVKKIQVVMGDYGNIVKLEVNNDLGVWTTIWNSTPPQSGAPGWWCTGRYYTWESGVGIKNATQVKITIRPSVWYVRTYWKGSFLWWRWGETHLYASGWDLYEVNIYDYYDPPDIIRNWSKKLTLTFNCSKSTPMSLNMKDVLQSYDMIPTDPELQDSLQNLHYRVVLGDTTDPNANPIPDCDPHITLTAFQQTIPDNIIDPGWKGGMKQKAANNGSIYFKYGDAIGGNKRVWLNISGCKEEARYSKQFTVITQEDTKIFIKRFVAMDKDEMWLPQINNGRLTREDISKHILYDYYIPEYNGQPFYPYEPYMYVEREEAEYVDGSTLRVKHTPIHVTYDNYGEPTNLKVYLDVNNVTIEIPVLTWNMYTGEIKIDRRINFTDRIFVDYYYTCHYLIYKGCAMADIKTKDISVPLNSGNNTVKFWYDLSSTPTENEHIPEIDKIEILSNDATPVLLGSYEAEAGTNTLGGDVAVRTLSIASGGKIITCRTTDPENFLQFNGLYAPQDNTYTLRIYYSSAADLPNVKFTVNNGPENQIEFTSTLGFHFLDLNPMPGHTYVADDGTEHPSSDLFNKSVWLYITPAFVLDITTGKTKSSTTMAIRHRIFDRTLAQQNAMTTIIEDLEDGDGCFILGKIDVKKPAVPSLTIVTDARRPGGGFKDKISKEVLAKGHQEALYTWDAGSWDGMPYPSNGVIEVTVPRSLLKEYGGKFERQEIEDIINQHVAFGVYVFVQYK